MARLGLGTVQFGLNYGISNKQGQVSPGEALKILTRAQAGGIKLLDTAAAYGVSENVLGQLATVAEPFRIVTKTLALKHGLAAVIERARLSVEILKRRPTDILMVHSAADLAGPEGVALWRELQKLKDEMLFRAIGISAYVADDPVALAEKFRPDAVQVPLSLLDQRLEQDGSLRRLKELGVEIHVRSIFLQGLLFLETAELPPKLRTAARDLERIRQQLAASGMSPLSGAMRYVLSRPEVDYAVVGVTEASQVDEIITAAQIRGDRFDWASCALNDPLVLTPSLW